MKDMLYKIKIDKILYMFDEPMLFTGKVGSLNSIFLRTDDDDDRAEFISCYIDQKHLDALEDGRISVRGVFEAQTDIYIVWTDRDYNVLEEKRNNLGSIAHKLPEKNVGLYRSYGECPDVVEERGTFLSIYFRGAGMSRDHIPYSTLMRLLHDVQSVVRSVVLPPQLRGMKSSTVDFLVGDPALGSLMISIKEPTFNLATINKSRLEKTLTNADIVNATERSKEEFMNMIDSLVESPTSFRVSLNQSDENELYETVRSLLPSEDTPFSDVTISTRSGNLKKRVSITKAKADAVRVSFEQENNNIKEIYGGIIEINSASYTILLKTNYGRVVTCAFDRDFFEKLRKEYFFKLGAKVTVSGEFWQRVRRDYIDVSDLRFA